MVATFDSHFSFSNDDEKYVEEGANGEWDGEDAADEEDVFSSFATISSFIRKMTRCNSQWFWGATLEIIKFGEYS